MRSSALKEHAVWPAAEQLTEACQHEVWPTGEALDEATAEARDRAAWLVGHLRERFQNTESRAVSQSTLENVQTKLDELRSRLNALRSSPGASYVAQVHQSVDDVLTYIQGWATEKGGSALRAFRAAAEDAASRAHELVDELRERVDALSAQLAEHQSLLEERTVKASEDMSGAVQRVEAAAQAAEQTLATLDGRATKAEAERVDRAEAALSKIREDAASAAEEMEQAAAQQRAAQQEQADALLTELETMRGQARNTLQAWEWTRRRGTPRPSRCTR